MIDIPAGWAAVAVAIIGVGSTILGLVLAWLTRLGHRLRYLEHRDRLNWLYIRSLIDAHYRGGPLPEPPDGWLEERNYP